MKVFGIGLSRTGTKSLTSALTRLGCRAVHYPRDERTLRELSSGTYSLSILEECDAITDITVAPYYAQLDRRYPGSKFILTVRERESWLASLEQHMARAPLDDLARFLRSATYGSYGFDRERMSYVQQLHERNVREYFAARDRDLLVMNIVAGDGWDVLCPFLGRDVLEEPFPHT